MVSLLKRKSVQLVRRDDHLCFDLLNGKLTVDLSPSEGTSGEVLAANERTGSKAVIWDDQPIDASKDSIWKAHQRAIFTTLSGVMALAGLVVQSLWMPEDLSKLPWLIHHSRRTLRIIRQNIVFSLTIKALFLILTFVGYASLWAAIAADMRASLLVIANGLRLLRS